MTDKTLDGKTIEIAELTNEHPYSFDTRLIAHKHLSDGSIVRLDTLDQYNNKAFIKRMSKAEFNVVLFPKEKDIV